MTEETPQRPVSFYRGIDEPVLILTAPLETGADTDEAMSEALRALGGVDAVEGASATAADGTESDRWMPAAVPAGSPPNDLKGRVAFKRARDNVEKWGQQSPVALALAIAEEVGELADEIGPTDCPEYHEDTVGESWAHLRSLVHNGAGVRTFLEGNYEDEEGQPVDERPPMVPEDSDMDTDAVREELYDLMALCYQLDWALYQGVREGAEE